MAVKAFKQIAAVESKFKERRQMDSLSGEQTGLSAGSQRELPSPSSSKHQYAKDVELALWKPKQSERPHLPQIVFQDSPMPDQKKVAANIYGHVHSWQTRPICAQ
jgi:hypothetical protein